MRSPTTTDVLIGARLRLKRKQLGLSQSKLAASLGITFQQVQKYENGTNRIGAGRLLAMAGTLNVPITYFFDGVGQAVDDDNQSAIDVKFLSNPGAIDLLSNFTKIEDPALRKVVRDLARRLASHSGRRDDLRDTSSEDPRPRGAKQA